MKLFKLINNFKQKHLNQQVVDELLDFEVLRTYLPKIFPSGAELDLILNLSKQVKKDERNTISVINLPYHMHDKRWLARYVNRVIEYHNDFKISNANIHTSSIPSFVQHDPEFDAARNQFEQDVIRAEIRNTVDIAKKKPYLISKELFLLELNSRTFNYQIPYEMLESSLNNNLELIYESDFEFIK